MECFRPVVAWSLIVASVMASQAGLEDGWPFVRGANFDGHAVDTGLADNWPTAGPPVLWTRELGQGYSAFVARDDRVYTQAQTVRGQYVYCLDAQTGATVWSHWYDWPYEAVGAYPGPRSTPTLHRGRVYFTSPDGLLRCLNAEDGAEVWSVELDEVYGITGSGFGYSCSPTVVDGAVILPVGGQDAGVVSFDAQTGRELWAATSDPASYTPAFPIELNGQPLVVCYMKNSLLILERATGQVFYRMKLSRGYDEHSAWPIFSEPYLWLSAPFQAGSRLLDLSTRRQVWESDLLSNDVCSSVCVEGKIYGFDIRDVQSKTHRPSKGIFRCIDLRTGKGEWANGTGRPRRSSNQHEFANVIGQSGIIAADGKLIVLNELGELILLKQNSAQCTELARCSVLPGELTWTAPCLHRRQLYVRNQSVAVCVYLGKPEDLGVAVRQRTEDIAEGNYFDLADRLLTAEPEYAFDVPHDRWLLQWWGVGLGMLLVSRVMGFGVARLIGVNSQLAHTAIAIVLGALGMTCIGKWTGAFVFTWPVCIFAGFEYVVVVGRNQDDEPQRRFAFFRNRLPAIAFLALSYVYFALCRRLSLIFEWAFLVGFVGAMPVLWFAYRGKLERTKGATAQVVVSLVGFTCFFAVCVLLFKLRY